MSSTWNCEYLELPDNFMEDCNPEQDQEGHLPSTFSSNHFKNAANCESVIGVQPCGGRTNAMEIRQSLRYLEERENITPGYKTLKNKFSRHRTQPQASTGKQRFDYGITNDEVRPAHRDLEIANSYSAPTIGEKPFPSMSQHIFLISARPFQIHSDLEAVTSVDDELNRILSTRANPSNLFECAKSYLADSLSTETTDDICIDTEELCRNVLFELKMHLIPHGLFARKILNRCQGTFSDILRYPRPWKDLKSGRGAYMKMYVWMQQPLETRLGLLRFPKEDVDVEMNNRLQSLQPTSKRYLNYSNDAGNVEYGNDKKMRKERKMFSEYQKKTLQATFGRTRYPTEQDQRAIAKHLHLDLSAVANFFTNARRRSQYKPLPIIK